jgi:hypothetical protein
MEQELPIGWKELPPTGEPGDAGTPEEDWEATAHPRHPREELRLWIRGGRYVRLCRVLKDGEKHPFAVHYGRIDGKGEDAIDEECGGDGALEEATKRAFLLMRMGGYP